ncbi:MAG: 50S ribosomal protein L24 [Candidatus Moranbacteria bacterium]|nr:50S ribosomal protein L24 [Candidatus Moranbacteria bacterium]MDZ4385478.1 50S ribosomal protein L24 [Candidatus Moranbacteria bacterium]
MKIKKNDQVKILAGKDRGKTGKVLRVISAENKIVVEGVNIVKKHVKPRKEGESGQRIEIPGKADISNVMLVCPKCGKPTRVGYGVTEKNKFRICKQCKAEL